MRCGLGVLREHSLSGAKDASLPFPHCPLDVADAVAFLASEDSGYITGATVEVTGMRPSWGGRTQKGDSRTQAV